MIYVTLPDNFIAIKYPGYFWNFVENKLYSMKIDGVLKPLYLHKPFISSTVRFEKPFYTISVKGRKRYLEVDELKDLKLEHSVIPMR